MLIGNERYNQFHRSNFFLEDSAARNSVIYFLSRFLPVFLRSLLLVAFYWFLCGSLKYKTEVLGTAWVVARRGQTTLKLGRSLQCRDKLVCHRESLFWVKETRKDGWSSQLLFSDTKDSYCLYWVLLAKILHEVSNSQSVCWQYGLNQLHTTFAVFFFPEWQTRHAQFMRRLPCLGDIKTL